MTFRSDLDTASAKLRSGVDSRSIVPILPTVLHPPGCRRRKVRQQRSIGTPNDQAFQHTWAALEAMDGPHNEEAWR